jgi:hypothetical protein
MLESLINAKESPRNVLESLVNAKESPRNVLESLINAKESPRNARESPRNSRETKGRSKRSVWLESYKENAAAQLPVIFVNTISKTLAGNL